MRRASRVLEVQGGTRRGSGARASSRAASRQPYVRFERSGSYTGPGAAELEAALALEDRLASPSRIAGLYRQAARLGQTDAMINLGAMLKNGDGVARSFSGALAWYRKAWERSHDPVAAYNLGVAFDPQLRAPAKGNRVAALRWYRRAVEGGVTHRLANLAWLLSRGRSSRDQAEAVRMYLKADRLDSATPAALYNLGLHFEFGRGVRKNVRRAMNCYRRAALRGDADAQVALGYNLLNGVGARSDVRGAVRWYQAAAAQGHLSAHFSLGQLHVGGVDLPENLALARRYLRFAARRGHRRSARLLERLSRRR